MKVHVFWYQCHRRAKKQTVKFELKYEKALKKVFLIMEFEVNNFWNYSKLSEKFPYKLSFSSIPAVSKAKDGGNILIEEEPSGLRKSDYI